MRINLGVCAYRLGGVWLTASLIKKISDIRLRIYVCPLIGSTVWSWECLVRSEANERVLIEISLVRELDDTGVVLQGELFLGSKYVQDVPRNVKQRLRGKGWLAGRKRTRPDKGG